MLIGKVVGSVVSTKKADELVGNKFMIVEPLPKFAGGVKNIIAIDNIGAGMGEVVMVATGSAARIGARVEKAPVDAAIVGIIDDPSAIMD